MIYKNLLRISHIFPLWSETEFHSREPLNAAHLPIPSAVFDPATLSSAFQFM